MFLISKFETQIWWSWCWLVSLSSFPSERWERGGTVQRPTNQPLWLNENVQTKTS